MSDRTEEARLADKMRLAGSLAGGAAHDLNNPLAGVVQAAQLLARNLDLEHPATRRLLDQHGFGPAEREVLARFIDRRDLRGLVRIVGECGARATGTLAWVFDFFREREPVPAAWPVRTLFERTVALARLGRETRRLFSEGAIVEQFEAPEELTLPSVDAPRLLHALLAMVDHLLSGPGGGAVPGQGRLILAAAALDDGGTGITVRTEGLPPPVPAAGHERWLEAVRGIVELLHSGRFEPHPGGAPVEHRIYLPPPASDR